MSWENVPLTIFNIPQATVTDFSWCDNPVNGSQGGNDKISITWKFADECGQQKDLYVLGNNSGYGLYVQTPDSQAYQNDYYQYNLLLNGQPQSPAWGQYVPKNHTVGGYNRRLGFIAVINEETQKGIFTFLDQRGGTLRNWMFATAKITGTTRPSDPVAGGNRVCYDFIKGLMPPEGIIGNGGGATHIAKVTGQLSSLSSNLSDILIVSGGGGGGFLIDGDDYDGRDAGGISGNGDNSGNQSTGYAFGHGESNSNASGGGSGLYGGYKGTNSKGGGAGSGYIGNSLLSNKKMVGYNVPTSSATATKTESVEVYSLAPLADYPKMGDGFARIKLVREPQLVNFWDLLLNDDLANAVDCGGGPTTAQWNSNDVLFYGETQKTKPTVTDGVFYHVGSTDYAKSIVSFPLKQNYNILGGQSKVNFMATAQDAYHNQWVHASVLLEQALGTVLSEYAYTPSQYPGSMQVSEFGIYQDQRLFSSVQNVRRIQVRFDYGTWEMSDIKVLVLN